MTLKTIVNEAKQLSRAEQAELLDELIGMLGPETDDVSLTPAQAADLDRRIAEYESGKVKLIPSDEAFRRLRNRT
jgi:putative addiction module component (TIGR02574 family)